MLRRIGLLIALLGVLLFLYDLTVGMFSGYDPVLVGEFLGYFGISWSLAGQVGKVLYALPLNMIMVIIGVLCDFTNRIWWEFQVARIAREVRAERRKLGDPE